MRSLRFSCLLAAAASLAGCIHMQGVVLEEPSNRPFTTARITVGRPGGLAIFASHDVDSHGRFDFYIGPTDDNDVYVYDTTGSVEDAIRLDRTEISDKMKIRMRPAPREQPGMPEMPGMP